MSAATSQQQVDAAGQPAHRSHPGPVRIGVGGPVGAGKTQLIELVHRARGEPVAAGFIAGKRRGINKEGVITGACGMNRGGGSGRPSANDGDLDIGLGIDLLRHEDYHCMSSTPRVCLGAQFGLR